MPRDPYTHIVGVSKKVNEDLQVEISLDYYMYYNIYILEELRKFGLTDQLLDDMIPNKSNYDPSSISDILKNHYSELVSEYGVDDVMWTGVSIESYNMVQHRRGIHTEVTECIVNSNIVLSREDLEGYFQTFPNEIKRFKSKN